CGSTDSADSPSLEVSSPTARDRSGIHRSVLRDRDNVAESDSWWSAAERVAPFHPAHLGYRKPAADTRAGDTRVDIPAAGRSPSADTCCIDRNCRTVHP